MRSTSHLFRVCLVATAACARAPDGADASSVPAPPQATLAGAVPVDANAPVLSPLQAADWLEPLPGALGFISAPMGAREPRPVVVGVHGHGDRPDWACSEWRAIFGPRPFIVCPSGSPLDVRASAFMWRSPDALKTAIARALGAADAMYAGYVAPPPRVYAGFSRGAILGASIVEEAPATYPYAIFLEGFGDVAAPRFARAFHDGGGRRILFGCSRAGCEAPRRPLVAALDGGGIDARIAYAGNVGHTVDAAVIASVQRELVWLLADDPRFTP